MGIDTSWTRMTLSLDRDGATLACAGRADGTEWCWGGATGQWTPQAIDAGAWRWFESLEGVGYGELMDGSSAMWSPRDGASSGRPRDVFLSPIDSIGVFDGGTCFIGGRDHGLYCPGNYSGRLGTGHAWSTVPFTR
jgi:hypothetical protein